MKIAVAGLWHLGSVTAACLAAKGHDVIAYDSNKETIGNFQNNQAPISEPGLDDLLRLGKETNKLHFTSTPADIADAEITWITFDTPVDENDIADVAFVRNEIKDLLPHIKNNSIILISSQLPVGSTRSLQTYFRQEYPEKTVAFACSPENLRLGKAISVFTNPDRIIIGLDNENAKTKLAALFSAFSTNIVWMSIESAEMTKHALNAFLATSVVFINELATLCEQVGANAHEVEQGLKSEERIGRKAYLRPGNPIAGGTLARDVNYLINIGQQNALSTPLFSALLDSNRAHKQWSCRKVTEVLKDLKNKNVAILGLTYKPDTDTLRRSAAIETCEWLANQGVTVFAYCPAIKQLPKDLAKFIHLKSSFQEAISSADAVIVCTEWPQFIDYDIEDFLNHLKQPFVLDPSGFLAKKLGNDKRLNYFSVGSLACN